MYNRRMSVLLLDAKYPSCMPIDVVSRHRESIAYTPQVPTEVRIALAQLGVHRVAGGELLLAMDAAEPDAAARIARGERVLRAGVPSPVARAVSVMRQAVARGEWERAQTHISLLPYLHEETAEFDAAVRSGNAENLRDELADVLLQVLFHAELAEDFAFDDVAAAFVAKMRARAPYLFDGSTGLVPIEVQTEAWEAGKTQ